MRAGFPRTSVTVLCPHELPTSAAPMLGRAQLSVLLALQELEQSCQPLR